MDEQKIGLSENRFKKKRKIFCSKNRGFVIVNRGGEILLQV